MKVVIVGASGFVGKHLIQRLLQDPSIQIRALARTLKTEQNGRVENIACDLFSLLDIEKALEGQQEAIYLVHSMLPSSQLSQGNFSDYDLILADNFARAAKKAGVRRILYMGGIIPRDNDEHPEDLSLHLRSRFEVEEIFRSYKIPVLALRAGMVLGKEGSSFQMLLRLVQRLPLMICPAWTRSRSSPIHVRDVVETFYYGLKRPELEGAYDLENGHYLNYLDMLEKTAQKLGKTRFFIDVPYFSPQFSKLWVRLITGAPKNLVYPLVDSLQHNMSPNPQKALRIPNWTYRTFEETLDEVIDEQKQTDLTQPKAYKKSIPDERIHIVQSVQRHPLPEGKSAEWASQEYIKWLRQNHRGLISVHTEGDKTRFQVMGTKMVLLELTLSTVRSSEDRVLFYITGGLLARENKRGRLEFRVTPDKKNLITAIHDFKPKLPWYLYKYSQALVHASVMRRFGLSLKSQNSEVTP